MVFPVNNSAKPVNDDVRFKAKMTHGVLSRPARIVLKSVEDYLSMLLCGTLRTESFGHVVDAVQSIPIRK